MTNEWSVGENVIEIPIAQMSHLVVRYNQYALQFLTIIDDNMQSSGRDFSSVFML